MAKRFVDDTSLSSVADAIREQTGKTESLVFPDEFVSSIGELGSLFISTAERTITKINNSNIKKLGKLAFGQCVELVSVELTKVTVGDSNAFSRCTKLTQVKLPSATYIGWGMCEYCEALQFVDLSANVTIEEYCFDSCSALKAVILRNVNNVCTLKGVSSFRNSGIATGIGYIYVPSALVDSYKAATNWSTYAAQFRALEDYTVDGTITGELDESKI